ncbi:MAG: hypothetical protein DRJ03_10510 [Chloroflexi bacterium]|nr:MAG: hypothetical protein B6I35_10900 [Anaerolineaceae bacterium 4572_32.2]RLC81935.1 MAG: hypothetical protein DRI81_01175 [Chloroflexota bacterium]RLC85815.1 MAG: hypothetical protein DRJ03_10510 [Chloroflexota bacterium]HEY72014.1 DUF2089 domain-containing protein [Thermoflexia bacterium]
MTKAPEERLKILQMLEEGKISAEEATTLLRALDGGQRPGSGTPGPTGENRYLRIHVSDVNSGKSKVNVTIPIGLVSAGLRIAERFAPEFDGLDTQELEELLASGMTGKMIEVVDEEDNELVEIYVE